MGAFLNNFLLNIHLQQISLELSNWFEILPLYRHSVTKC